jgi:hypothetical protein
VELKLPDLAADAGRSFREQIVHAGGVDLARGAEREPAQRDRATAIVQALGIEDLDVRGSLEHALAAGELCRVAGEYVLPYPIVGELLATSGNRLTVVGTTREEVPVNHGDLGDWTAVGIDGRGGRLVVHRPVHSMLAPFVTTATVSSDAIEVPVSDVALWLILDSWIGLGAMQRALTMAAAHIVARVQFGHPLSHFQALRFRVADRVAAVAAVEALVHFTTWSAFAQPSHALVDALALRTVMIETLRPTLRESHQLYGALGFCDEVDLSIINRHIQPHARLPWDFELTSHLLTVEVERVGLRTLFGLFGGTPSPDLVDGESRAASRV